MKKFFITMLAAVAATASFAQNPKIDKEIAATKSYAAGLEIYKQNESQMTPEVQQKAALALNKLAKSEAQPAIEHLTANQGTNDDYRLVANMINAADLCKKVGAKGAVDIVKNVQGMREEMLKAANSTNDNDKKLMYALTYINSAEANDPKISYALYFAAYASFNKNDFANAVKYSKECVSLNDDRILKNAQQVYLQSLENNLKTKEDTLVLIEALKEVDVNKFFVEISSLYIDMGMKDKVQTFIDDALAKNPENILAYFMRGTLKAEKQEYDGALVDYKKVVELDPNFVLGWFNLAKCYGNIADDISLNKADSRGRLIGEDLKKCSEAYEGAADALEHVRALDPNCENEKTKSWPMLLRRYYQSMGKTDKAKEISKIIGDE